MKKNKLKQNNLIKLLFGQSLLLIGFNIYSVVLLYLLVQEYHASARVLGIFGILAALPPALIAIGAPILGQIKNSKTILIMLQVMATFALIIGGSLLLTKQALILVGGLYLLLSIATTISGSVEVGFIPIIFQEDEAAIEKSVDLQYFMSTGLTIITSIISSFILLAHGSTWLLWVSFITTPLGIGCYLLISYAPNKDMVLVNINDGQLDRAPVASYYKQMQTALYQFTHTMPAFLIILFEAILGGVTGLLFELLPLTMKELGIAVAFFSIVSATQKVGDLLGGALAPLVKWSAPTFFGCDYLISGSCFIAITLPLPNSVRLLLLLLAGIFMGMSGNVFEKLMYRSFNVGDISAMHALTTSTFALFSVISYFVAWIHIPTIMLWQLTGVITIVFGGLLMVIARKLGQVSE